MNENKLKKIFPHIFFILLSILLPLLILSIVVLTFNRLYYISSVLYYYTPLLYAYSPLFVMLILYVFGRRTLSSIDIELYGGLSSRFMILSSFFLRGLLGYDLLTFLIYELPLYGFIAPLEDYILLYSYGLLYEYGELLDIMSILFTLFIVTLYSYLIFRGRRYQVKVLKIFYSLVILISILIMIGSLGSRMDWIGVIALIFIPINIMRIMYTRSP